LPVIGYPRKARIDPCRIDTALEVERIAIEEHLVLTWREPSDVLREVRNGSDAFLGNSPA
jgi:hypothetical protein